MKKFGINKARSFQNHSKNAVASIIAAKGIAPFTTSSKRAFPTAWIINKLSPTGGVISAVSIKITKNIPNQIGSMPIVPKAGNKTGTIIKSILSASKKNPIINKTAPTARINSPAFVRLSVKV